MLPVESIGDPHEGVFVGDEEFGVRAAAREPEDAFAGAPAAGVGADRRDLTRELHPRNVRWRAGRCRVAAFALEDVRAVERRGAHAHQDLACGRHRTGAPLLRQHFRSAGSRDHDRAHGRVIHADNMARISA